MCCGCRADERKENGGASNENKFVASLADVNITLGLYKSETAVVAIKKAVGSGLMDH